MPTPSTSDLPIPKSWDEFEDIVWDIYTRKWEDPRAQRYGRQGQSQNGIDIYGQKNSSNKYIAIQCKRYTKTKLTEKRIATNIIKAELFSSPISEYWIATTQSRDSKIQDFIRAFNDKRKLEEKFIIHIIFWDDLCSCLASPDNHDFLVKHYSEWKQIFLGKREGETEKPESIRYLLTLDIQQDCDFLKEILDHNERKYLSRKWQLCLSQNRSIWKDTLSRISLARIGDELMRSIQDFYKKLDNIEESCKILINLNVEVELLKSKPRYMGNMTLSWKGSPLPERYEKYFTDVDELELLNSKMINSIKLRELKETIHIALNSGNQIITELNQK